MKSKWKFTIESLKDYVVGEDKKIYRKPYSENKRYYTWREVKIQNPKRYRMNDEWWSVRQLRKKLVLDPNPIVIFAVVPETPW